MKLISKKVYLNIWFFAKKIFVQITPIFINARFLLLFSELWIEDFETINGEESLEKSWVFYADIFIIL